MTIADIIHSETWTVQVRREKSDAWPDVTTLMGGVVRPELITIHLARGSGTAAISVAGPLKIKDGVLSKRPVSINFYGNPPEWVEELAAREREKRGLGPGATGCGW